MVKSNGMTIVLDANVVFDFDRVGYLGQMLRLGHSFHTTNYIEREIKSINTAMLRACGLVVGILSGSQNSELGKIRAEFRDGPSINDVSAFVYARDKRYALATRDSGLWQITTGTPIQVYETHDLLQMMVEESLVSREEAAGILTKMNSNQQVKIQKWIDLAKDYHKK